MRFAAIDFETAAQVVLRAAQEHGVNSFEELAMRTCLRMGQVASSNAVALRAVGAP